MFKISLFKKNYPDEVDEEEKFSKYSLRYTEISFHKATCGLSFSTTSILLAEKQIAFHGEKIIPKSKENGIFLLCIQFEYQFYRKEIHINYSHD